MDAIVKRLMENHRVSESMSDFVFKGVLISDSVDTLPAPYKAYTLIGSTDEPAGYDESEIKTLEIVNPLKLRSVNSEADFYQSINNYNAHHHLPYGKITKDSLDGYLRNNHYDSVLLTNGDKPMYLLCRE